MPTVAAVSTTRDRILDASETLFRRGGMPGTGIKQILTLARAPYGSLYHHFPGGKDELAAETIARAGAGYGRRVAEKLTADADLVTAIRAAFVDAAEELEASGYADACPIETVALEVASTHEMLRGTVDAVFTSWLEALDAILVSGGVPAQRARPLSLTILSAMEGAFILSRTARTRDAVLACGDAMADLVAAARA